MIAARRLSAPASAVLRGIVGNVLRDHLRTDGRKPGGGDALLAELEDPASALSRHWDEEHDRHVFRGLLARVEPEFAPATWAAFTRTALDGRPPAEVAAELGLSHNAVYLARAWVLARLRHEAAGFLDAV